MAASSFFGRSRLEQILFRVAELSVERGHPGTDCGATALDEETSSPGPRIPLPAPVERTA